MNDTNVGMGMVPHKKGCRCSECEVERLRDALDQAQGELKIKSEFLSSRQCPDHLGKWGRGNCLQCRIEQLEAALRKIVASGCGGRSAAALMQNIANEALQLAGDTTP